MSHTVAEGLEQVQARIHKACQSAGRDPENVTLVAISKMKPTEDIRAALDEGQLHFGENRAKELQDKMDELSELEDIKWHMVGTLQTNKIKYMVERVDWIDSIPKKKSLREIEKRASRIDRVINTLIQVNISQESQKSGCDPDDLPAILEYAQDLDHVRVRGLMGMAEFVKPEQQEKVRHEFRLLRELREKYADYAKGSVDLEHLSMGMTNDMEVAIDEGSTMVRVGRAIFGERDCG